MLAERLRKKWRDRDNDVAAEAEMRFVGRDLILGAATVLLPGEAARRTPAPTPEPRSSGRDDSGDFEDGLLAGLQGITPAEAKRQTAHTDEVNISTVTPAANGNLTQAIVEANARARIRMALRDPRTSPTAKAVLNSFLTGDGPRNFVFGPGSPGLSALFADDPTGNVNRQIRGVIAYMLAKYPTPYLDDGYVVTGYKKGNFSPYDAVMGLGTEFRSAM